MCLHQCNSPGCPHLTTQQLHSSEPSRSLPLSIAGVSVLLPKHNPLMQLLGNPCPVSAPPPCQRGSDVTGLKLVQDRPHHAELSCTTLN